MPILALAILIAAVPPPAAASATHPALTSAVEALRRAIVANDAAEIDRWVTSDWIVIDGTGGTVTRDRFLEATRTGELVHRSMDFSNVQLRNAGTAVIWTGEANVTGSYAGHPFVFHEVSGNVWVKERGRWRCKFTQLTPMGEKSSSR